MKFGLKPVEHKDYPGYLCYTMVLDHTKNIKEYAYYMLGPEGTFVMLSGVLKKDFFPKKNYDWGDVFRVMVHEIRG